MPGIGMVMVMGIYPGMYGCCGSGCCCDGNGTGATSPPSVAVVVVVLAVFWAPATSTSETTSPSVGTDVGGGAADNCWGWDCDDGGDCGGGPAALAADD